MDEEFQKSQRELKKERAQERKNQKDLTSQKAICSHFKKGTCKHGLLGMTKTEDRDSCSFHHPKVCMNWINNGNNRFGNKGCMDKKECPDFHPTICKSSLTSRTCKNIEGKNKCNRGYHLKGTTYKNKNEDKKN